MPSPNSSNPRDLSDEVLPADNEDDEFKAQMKLAECREMQNTFETPGWRLIANEIIKHRDASIRDVLGGDDVDVARTALHKGKFQMAGVVLGLPDAVKEYIKQQAERIEAQEEEA